ncbi:MAG: IS1634 family transposase [Holosporales bacterium]|nr:IS1634 family transposase [Holosporales bacterium]
MSSFREGTKVKTKIILNLGASFEFPRELWPRLCSRIETILYGQKMLFPEEDSIEQYARVLASRIRATSFRPPKKKEQENIEYEDGISVLGSNTENGRSVGAEHVALHGIQTVNLPEIFKLVGFNHSQIKMALGLVAARMVHPSSERETYRWLSKESALGELLGIDFSTKPLLSLYRISDLIYENIFDIEKKIFSRVSQLFNLSQIITLYDLTNTYFEGNPSTSKAKRGRSKEKRSDCPLITVALVLDSSGFIRRTKFFAGNVSEQETLEKMLIKLEAEPGNLVIMDRGISTSKNIAWLIKNKYRYLVVSKETYREFDHNLASPLETASGDEISIYRTVNKDCTEARLHCYSEKRAIKENGITKRRVDILEDGLNKLNKNLSNSRCKKNLEYILKKIGNLETKSKGIAQHYKITVIDNSKEKKETDPLIAKQILFEKIPKEGSILTSPGVYCLKTNDLNFSAIQMWQTYIMLTDLESVFRSLKSELGLRPIFHWKGDRIEGHLFITILAYQSVQAIRQNLKKNNINDSWWTIRNGLINHQRTTTVFPRRDLDPIKIRKANIPEPYQKKIYETLNITSRPGGVKKLKPTKE